jgi:hypothetical protein
MSDSIPKGAVLEEMRAKAKGILKNLKRRVESLPREAYLMQADTGSRPLIPVALAKLFGATLPDVEGEDLTEVFEAMVRFIESPEGEAEGKAQLKIMEERANKVSLESKTLASYRLAYFIDLMKETPGNAELFSPYARKSKELVNRIKRESDYRTSVAERGYLRVDIRKVRYALRLEDGRRFILLPELTFIHKMKEARAVTAAGRPNGTPPEGPPPTANGTAADAGNATHEDMSAPTFQATDVVLLKRSAP